MTQSKTGASHIGGRLFKSAASSALALSALAGGVVLSGGEVKAFNCTFDQAGTGTCEPLINNTWIDPNIMAADPFNDKQLWLFDHPSDGIGDIEWSTQNTPPMPGSPPVEWHVDVDFNPDYNGGVSVFNYAIKIDHPTFVFKEVALTTAVTPGTTYSTVKDVFAATLDPTTGAPVCGARIAQLTNPPSPDGWDPIGGKVICVTDTLTVQPLTGNVDMYQNAFRQVVPGPLPILGAGAAFGFSRKLRSRIKAFRTA